MTIQEYRAQLYKLKFTCGFNHRYHQLMAWRWRIADRAVRIAVGILAVAGLTLATPGITLPWTGFCVAVVSLLTAVVLNILPLGDWEKQHTEFFRQWTDLLKEATVAWFKTAETEGEGQASPQQVGLLNDLTARAHVMHAAEPLAVRKLLRRCEEYEKEAEGHGGWPTTSPLAAEQPASEVAAQQ